MLTLGALLTGLAVAAETAHPTPEPTPVIPLPAPTQAQVLFQLHAELRAELGLQPLVWDTVLAEMAQARAQDMADRNYFSHTTPEGTNVFDDFAERGYLYWRAGENIAFNRGYPEPARTAMDGFINSPGHYANIVQPDFNRVGVGAVQRQSDGAWYFAVVFATPR